MAIFKSLFGEYFDCEHYIDIAVAEIVGLAVSQENKRIDVTIKPYRKIEEQKIIEQNTQKGNLIKD